MGTRIAVLKDGILQQLDTPQNLYDSPDNVFVAGFIGSPAMNFFDATLVGTNEDMYIDAGSFRIKVPEKRRAVLAPYLGKEITFGIRPEDIHDSEYVPGRIEPAHVKAKVDVTELMGNEVFVYLVAGDKTFIARVDPRTKLTMGMDTEVVFSLDHIQIFDHTTEKVIR